jgi:hypothetical protein
MGGFWVAVEVAVAVVVCIPIAISATTGVPIGGRSAYAASNTAPTITRSAHVTFANCNARRIVLRVTVARHAFQVGEPVTVEVQLSNAGTRRAAAPWPSRSLRRAVR